MRAGADVRISVVFVSSALVLLAGCAAPPPRSAESAIARSDAAPTDTVRLARLEREARALAMTGGCATASTCRTAPLGLRACGGPRAYIAYCAATTDSIALFRKLDELKAADSAYNEATGMMSTCEMRLPSRVTLEGGRCAASR
jgi:hypothetical protein